MKSIFLVAATLLSIFLHTNVLAGENELNFFPVVGIGESTLVFTRKDAGPGDADETANFNVINLAGVLAYDNFFINIATDIPLDDDTYYTTNIDPPDFSNGVTTVDREDYNLTLGYGPFNWMTLFAGYTIGLTRFTTTTPAGFGFVSDHDDRGGFAGFGLSTNIAKQGSLSFDVAYASFDGEVRQRTGDPALINFNDRRVTGPTTGYSYGLQWTAKFRQDMSYFVKFKIRNYEFKPEEANGVPLRLQPTVEKNFTMLSAGLIF